MFKEHKILFKDGVPGGGVSEVPNREMPIPIDHDFAAKRLDEMRAREKAEVGAEHLGRRQESNEGVYEFVVAEPPLTVNRMDIVNREAHIKEEREDLFLASVKRSPNDMVSPDQMTGETPANNSENLEQLYNGLFSDPNFLDAYDRFDGFETLIAQGVALSAEQKKEYDTLRDSISVVLAQYNLTLDSPEFIQFKVNRKREKFNELISDQDSEIYPLVVELEELYSKKELTPEQTARLAEVEKQLDQYLSAQGFQFNKQAFQEYFKEKKRMAIYAAIEEFRKTDPALYQWAKEQLDYIDKRLNSTDPEEHITEEEAEMLADEVLREVIKRSQDKKLKGMWSDYAGKQEEVAVSPVTASGVEAARSYFDGSGLILTSPSIFGSGCSVESSDNTGFSCEINVDKDSNGNFTYTIEDPLYANNGVDGPYTAEQLAEAVDGRHMDVYLTRELRKAGLDEAGDVGNTPDGQIIDVCRSLIGGGKDRGFKFIDTNLDVIRGLVEVLKQKKDPEYSTTSRKIYGLSLYLRGEDKSRVMKIREACLPKDEKYSKPISSLIGMKLEDLEKEAKEKES